MKPDLSALLAAIGNLTSTLSTDLVRDALQAKADTRFHWLLISTGVVALGVGLEAWEATNILKRWYRFKRGKEAIAPNEKSWAIPASYLGLLLVIVGVVGEGVFETLVSNEDTALRGHDTQILAQTQHEADEANDRATAAESHAAEVEESVAPRRLTKAQGLVAKQLSRFPEQPVAAISNTFDVEASVFAADILATLHSAGWETDTHWSVSREVSSLEKAPSIPGTGIFVSSSQDRGSQLAAKAVVRVLSSEGFDCRIPKKSVVGFGPDERMVVIDVEARPEGPQGEAKLRENRPPL